MMTAADRGHMVAIASSRSVTATQGDPVPKTTKTTNKINYKFKEEEKLRISFQK